MARIGEGDPRWIVEDRKDGANVNNWHWTEKDLSNWAFEKLKSLILNTKVKGSIYSYEINCVIVSGVASIYVRKGKLRKIYDLEIKIDFKCSVGEDQIDGRILIPEFSFESGSGDVQYLVSSDSKCSSVEKVLEFVKSSCKAELEPKLNEFITCFDEQAKNIKLPKKDDMESESLKFEIDQDTTKKIDESHKEILIEEEFYCSTEFLYQLFTQAEKISAYTCSKTVFTPQIGSSYSYLDGRITGTVQEIEINKRLLLTWRFNDWKYDHYSTVELIFTNIQNGVRLKLIHSKIPDSDEERVKIGWYQYFLKPIQRVFCIGSGTIDYKMF